MVVKHEIKSQLAKLLATEDIIVEHKKVETAQFNVHTRVLILPLWEKASNNVYDMLVGHEVGHALFTPDEEWWLEMKIPPQFVNIVEDARIEKLMKRKYPGLAKSFYSGYNELNDRDFFQINDEDLTTFNLADRINLYFKVGNYISLVFSTAEKQIISMIEKCETFEDTKKASLVLYEYCKVELEEKEKAREEIEGKNGEQEFDDSGSNGEKDLDDMSDEELLEELERGSTPEKSNPDPDLDTPSYQEGGLDVKTVESFEEGLKDLSDKNARESVYVELPTVDLKKIIIDNKLIHDGINESFVEQQHEWDTNERTHMLSLDLFDHSDSDFIKFKKSAQKEVNYLVKEFECRKAADNYARSATNRTGVLDTTKLHTYRFNEDIFKRVTTVSDGKNHGLIFVLDWSGSMAHVMLDTIKQLYNLLWFCKKVNIPFEVYAFTNEYPCHEGIHQIAYEKKE